MRCGSLGERALTGGGHIVRQQACLTQAATDFRFISTVPGKDPTPATFEESKIHFKTNFHSVLKLITLQRLAQRLTKYFYISLFFCFFRYLLLSKSFYKRVPTCGSGLLLARTSSRWL